MKKIVYLLITLLPITACKKGIGIPEEYSFLKGTWYCGYCVYDSMRIENHRIVFTSNKLRPNVIYFDELRIVYDVDTRWRVDLYKDNKNTDGGFNIFSPHGFYSDTLYHYGQINVVNMNLGDLYVKK